MSDDRPVSSSTDWDRLSEDEPSSRLQLAGDRFQHPYSHDDALQLIAESSTARHAEALPRQSS